MENKKISYRKILCKQIPKYKSLQCKGGFSKHFASDDEIVIVGTFQYIPNNPDAVKRFKELVNQE